MSNQAIEPMSSEAYSPPNVSQVETDTHDDDGNVPHALTSPLAVETKKKRRGDPVPNPVVVDPGSGQLPASPSYETSTPEPAPDGHVSHAPPFEPLTVETTGPDRGDPVSNPIVAVPKGGQLPAPSRGETSAPEPKPKGNVSHAPSSAPLAVETDGQPRGDTISNPVVVDPDGGQPPAQTTAPQRTDNPSYGPSPGQKQDQQSVSHD